MVRPSKLKSMEPFIFLHVECSLCLYNFVYNFMYTIFRDRIPTHIQHELMVIAAISCVFDLIEYLQIF